MICDYCLILNLGCGNHKIPGAINVDISGNVDEVFDLSHLPWKWHDETVDVIIMEHFLEHMKDIVGVIKECYRILKPNGELIVTVPHSSSVIGIGCLGHYHTFSYNTLKDYLSCDFYLFGHKMFKTVYQRIVWQPHYEWVPIQWLIDLSPRAFERFWCYFVGGACETRWTGIKITT